MDEKEVVGHPGKDRLLFCFQIPNEPCVPARLGSAQVRKGVTPLIDLYY